MPKEFTDKSSNSELVQDLIEILKKEASLFETFLELLEQQQEALVRNDLTAINNVTERQREKIIEAGILSRKREMIVGLIADDYDSRGNLTVSRLVEIATSGQAEILTRLRETILELNDRIAKMRSQNEFLIDRSREIIMKTMELLARLKTPDDGYRNRGESSPSQTNLALDRRV
ncbi:hypothetical protein TRIP_C30021 [Candidatus Zixiibacteriota bacterium]|nr:hypothetical protein TRIP_C30021 [candidate division Zixibacteria bacterium]